MQHKRLTALAAIGAAVAGLVPASLAAASQPQPAASGDEYCSAHLALEAAIVSDDPEDDAPAAEAAAAAAPDDVAAALATASENAPTDGPPAPEYSEAWATVIDYVRETCGFAELDVLAQDYSFGGIGGEVAAGPTVINFLNEGTEYHELVLVRRNEGVTATVDELLAMPEDESDAMVTFVGFVLAAPGESSATVIDLAPGSYIGLCFIPVGTTPEALAEMMAGGSAPPDASDAATADTSSADTATAGSAPAETMVHGDSVPLDSMPPDVSMAPGEEGPPHFTQGMVVEFTVVEGGTTDTAAPATAEVTATTTG
jgi:hypothetical protein